MYWILGKHSTSYDDWDDHKKQYASMGAEPDLDYLLGDFLWISGQKLEVTWPGGLEYYIDPDGGDLIPDILFTGTPLVTKKFIEVLEGQRINNYQAFEVTLLDKNSKKVDKEFFAFNLLDRLNGVDLENTSLEKHQGVFFLRKLSLIMKKQKASFSFE